ncbi:MAG: CDP-glucose 4,6-dehydratase [Methylobacter sp.]|nr:CDP-glucose 4,6-dehydratase [Methylobacter sp.]
MILSDALFDNQYRDRSVLLTGHTGFKGSWLALWLQEMGAMVHGIALDPCTMPNHWDRLALDMSDRRVDIRFADAVLAELSEAQPEIVFHLAAQPLVRRSYRDPVGTWASNVMGTVNLLEACRKTPSVRAIIVVTSDKCYQNKELSSGYRENDALGGHDPYSASKAGAEIVAASYRSSFFGAQGGPLMATARAGNVIGGGDWSEDRLIPDLVRALANRTELEVRSPHATRPWQHVLESLSGYLLLGQKLLQGQNAFAQAWNFGPPPEGNRCVADLLDGLVLHWPELRWHVADIIQPHEANLLYLDSSKARRELGWLPVWTFEQTLAVTADWYRQFYASQQLYTRSQLADYVLAARNAGLEWAAS